LLLLAILSCAAGTLRAEIYECVEPGGQKKFTNIKSEAKGCKLLDIVPNTVSVPKSKSETKGPASFPRVDAKTQKQRDADRRRILEQELVNEQKLLNEAKKDLADQEAIRLGSERNYQRVLDRLEPYKKRVKLHEDNVANLQKELANLP
jgi:hypothetical protein